MKRVSMLDRCGVLGVLFLAFWFAGCKGTSLNPKTDLELRLEAAHQIMVVADRDKSMALIATDSAEEGDYRLSKKALDGIHDLTLRDRTTESAAIRLVKAGERTQANKMAETIMDPVVRNATLRRLADNDVGAADPAGTQPTTAP